MMSSQQPAQFSNILFIGGIHGVGKSTVCQVLISGTTIEYLSASEVLKWTALNQDHKNKKVTDIPFTQDRLIDGLKSIVEDEKIYLLDGHYCLLNAASQITNVPITTFEQINPSALYIVTGEVKQIKYHLEKRDQRTYEYYLLEEMQETELEYASQLAQHLGKPLVVGNKSDYMEIKNSIDLIYQRK